MPIIKAPMRRKPRHDAIRVFKTNSLVTLQDTPFWNRQDVRFIAHPAGTVAILHKYKMGAIQLMPAKSFFDRLKKKKTETVTSGRKAASIFGN